MPHEASVQPEASIASTGKGIRYIENWAYALSGKVPCDNNGATIIESVTGSGFILANFDIFNFADVSLNEDMSFLFSLNDLDIGYIRIGSGIELYRSNPLTILLPPFSKITVSGKNEASTSANNLSVIMSGRVYGAE